MKDRIVFLVLLAVLAFDSQGELIPSGNLPFPASKLTVVIAEADRVRTPQEAAAFSAGDWQEAVKSKNGEWRTLPAGMPKESMAEPFKTAMSRQLPSLPYLMISDGRRGFEGPVPLGDGEIKKVLDVRF